MLEIFQYEFMIRAFIAGSAIALTAPVIGMFLVVKKYSLMSDALSHVALLGVALGFMLQVSPLFSAIITAIVAAFFMEKLRKNKTLSGDSILALFLSGSLALALVIMSLNRGLNINFFNFLFGSISTVSTTDAYIIVSLSVLVLLTVIAFYKEFLLVSLSEELAQANGLKTEVYNIALTVLSALIVALAIKIVGALLIGALTVIPVTASLQFKQGFLKTMAIAIIVSLFSVITGLFISYYGNVSAGGAIVLTALAVFLLSSVFPSIKRA